jgi:hypothetical protein
MSPCRGEVAVTVCVLIQPKPAVPELVTVLMVCFAAAFTEVGTGMLARLKMLVNSTRRLRGYYLLKDLTRMRLQEVYLIRGTDVKKIPVGEKAA